MRHGYYENAIKFLLDEGADPNLGIHLDFFGENEGPADRKSGLALSTAAWTCSPKVFVLLLAKGAKLEYATPLHWIVWAYVNLLAPRIEMIKHLVNLGVDINGGDERQVEKLSYRVGSPLEVPQRPYQHGDHVGEEGEASWQAAM